MALSVERQNGNSHRGSQHLHKDDHQNGEKATINLLEIHTQLWVLAWVYLCFGVAGNHIFPCCCLLRNG
jgi:hypothetical protein